MIVFVNILYSGRPNPKDFNLPSDYNFAEWVNLFYKIYTEKSNYIDAKTQCESDGTFLAIPRSQAENDFFAALIAVESIWIGINDIEEEGNFVDVNGLDPIFTNWYSDEPSGSGSNVADEDGVELYLSRHDGLWNDLGINAKLKFVCSIHIQGINFNHYSYFFK